MTRFNGHKNWNHWNVSLWINNDEGLYNTARSFVRQCQTRDAAAYAFLRDLADLGITKTPDGAPYSLSSVRAAMVGM
jgi:hypothetical protein